MGNLGFAKSNPKAKFGNADKEKGKQNVKQFWSEESNHVPDYPQRFPCTSEDTLTETSADPKS